MTQDAGRPAATTGEPRPCPALRARLRLPRSFALLGSPRPHRPEPRGFLAAPPPPPRHLRRGGAPRPCPRRRAPSPSAARPHRGGRSRSRAPGARRRGAARLQTAEVQAPDSPWPRRPRRPRRPPHGRFFALPVLTLYSHRTRRGPVGGRAPLAALRGDWPRFPGSSPPPLAAGRGEQGGAAVAGRTPWFSSTSTLIGGMPRGQPPRSHLCSAFFRGPDRHSPCGARAGPAAPGR